MCLFLPTVCRFPGTWPLRQSARLWAVRIRLVSNSKSGVCTSLNRKQDREWQTLILSGDHPNFRENALGVKRPFSELWERSGYSQSSSRSPENNSRNAKSHSRNGISRDLCNAKTTILGATPGAIPGIDGTPHPERRKLTD